MTNVSNAFEFFLSVANINALCRCECKHALLVCMIDSPLCTSITPSYPPRRQLYWYHPRVARLTVIGRSQWLPHGHGTLYRNMFGTRLLFPSSAESWRPFCSGRRSLMRPDNLLRSICLSVVQCWSVTMYRLLQTVFIDIVTLYGGLAAAMP